MKVCHLSALVTAASGACPISSTFGYDVPSPQGARMRPLPASVGAVRSTLGQEACHG